MTRIFILAGLLSSVIFNVYLVNGNNAQEEQIKALQNQTRLIITDNGEYELNNVNKIFQSIKQVDQRSLTCMATNIYREAATESMAGKIAVGQVVLNRAKSKKYPRDICAVIYQKAKRNGVTTCQFSWVCVKKLPAIEQTSEAWKKSLRAAHAVLSYDYKIMPDITNGATHYHSHMVNPDWKNGVKLAAVIDQHRFYRVQ